MWLVKNRCPKWVALVHGNMDWWLNFDSYPCVKLVGPKKCLDRQLLLFAMHFTPKKATATEKSSSLAIYVVFVFSAKHAVRFRRFRQAALFSGVVLRSFFRYGQLADGSDSVDICLGP